MIKILSLDPGLAHTGWATFIYDPKASAASSLVLVNGGVIKTVPQKKETVSRSNSIRTLLLVEEILPLFKDDLTFLFMEAQSNPRSSTAATKTGYMRGAALALAHVYGLPVFEATPQAVKKALTNRISASKKEIEDAVVLETRPVGKAASLLAEHPKTRREHLADAMGVALAVLESREFLAVLKALLRTL